MKPVLPTVCFVLLVVSSYGQATTPAPRPRLQPNPPPEAQLENPPASTPAVPMERYVVKEGKLPAEPAQPVQRQGPFTLLEGGSILQRGKGGAVVEIGLWPWENVSKDAAKYQPPRTRVDMEGVRVRW